MYAFRGLVAELMVKTFCKIPAQTAEGRKVGGFAPLLRHGTGVAPWAAKPDRIACWLLPENWPLSGRKMLVLVSSGTAVCASDIRPSNAANRKVLSLVTGNPTVAPNCSRVRLSFL